MVFSRPVDTVMINSYIIYQSYPKSPEISRLEFMKQLKGQREDRTYYEKDVKSQNSKKYNLAFQKLLMYHSVKQQKSKKKSFKIGKLATYVHPRK